MPLPAQLPANVPKAVDNGPCSHREDQEEAPGTWSWLQTGPAPTLQGILGVNCHLEYSMCYFASKINSASFLFLLFLKDLFLLKRTDTQREGERRERSYVS